MEKSLSNQLDSYQRIQYEHDESFHPDILALGVLGRMKHIVFHFMKYFDSLSDFPIGNTTNERALIDSFVMTSSACNLLNIRMSLIIDGKKDFDTDYNGFLIFYRRSIAKLAKACESADHQEDYPIHKVWRDCIIELSQLVFYMSEKIKYPLIESSKKRLRFVEENNELFFLRK